MEHSGQVLGVSTKPTSKGPIYLVNVGGLEFSTFKEDLGAKAGALQGQMVTVEYTEKITTGRNGQTYRNLYLTDIAGSGEEIPPAATRENVTEPVAGTSSLPPEREARIVRQSAMKTAFQFAGALYHGKPESWEEAEARALTLAAQIYKYAWGGPGHEPDDPAA